MISGARASQTTHPGALAALTMVWLWELVICEGTDRHLSHPFGELVRKRLGVSDEFALRVLFGDVVCRWRWWIR